MQALSLQTVLLWSADYAEDRRFRLILAQTLAAGLLLAAAAQTIPIPQPEADLATQLPPRYVHLLPELVRSAPAQTPLSAAPAAITPPPAQAAPTERPAAPLATPRQKAASSGVLAMGDALARLQLRATRPDANPGTEINGAELPSPRHQNPKLTENLTRGSPGLEDGVDHRAVLGKADWPQREDTPRADHDPAAGRGSLKEAPMTPPGGMRSQQEIQELLDRNKGDMYTLYNRALQNNAGLRGKLVLSISIAPAGTVTRCVIISSELGSDSLERQLVELITRINFGSKPGASPVTTNIPIEFFPQ